MLLQNLTVPARVSDKQDESVQPRITSLQLPAAIDGLDVAQLRLGFDTDPCWSDRDHPVQGTRIARDRQWHLCLQRDGCRESSAEPRQEAELAGVMRRIVCRIRTQDQLIPDRCTGKRELLDGHCLELIALDAAKGRSMEAHRRGGARDAQPDRDPRLSHVADDRGDRLAGADPRPISAALIRRHSSESGSLHFSADYPRVVPTPTMRR
jgi:hypothetical protein